MSNINIFNSIIAPLIGVIGAIAGYLFREFQFRPKNLIHTYSISSLSKYSDIIEIKPDLLKKIKKSSLPDVQDFKENTTYRLVNSVWDRFDDVKLFWPNINNDINELLKLKSDSSIINKIVKIMEYKKFDFWMMLFLIGNLADNQKLLSKKEIKIKTIDLDEEGDVYFEFPQKNLSFHVGKNKALLSKAKILIDNITYWNQENLLIIFKNFQIYMDKEYKIALQVVEELKTLKDEQSRWVFYLQISNISKYPILFELNPIVTIKGGKNKYNLDLYTALIDEKDNIDDTNMPILVDSKNTIRLAVITNELEKDIEFGNAIREIFENEIGTFRINWPIIKPGIVQKSNIKTRYQKFVG